MDGLLETLVNPYYMQVMTMLGIYLVAALGLNLITGVTGQFSLGQGQRSAHHCQTGQGGLLGRRGDTGQTEKLGHTRLYGQSGTPGGVGGKCQYRLPRVPRVVTENTMRRSFAPVQEGDE